MKTFSMVFLRSAFALVLLWLSLAATSITGLAQTERGDPCNQDSDCTGIDLCLIGACSQNPRGCISTNDCGRFGRFSECTGGHGTRMCDEGECRADNDCRGNLVCTDNRRCIVCEEDRDCSAPNAACLTASFVGDNRCVECVENFHCGAGRQCAGGNRCENICAAGTTWVSATSKSGGAPRECSACISATENLQACRSQRDCAIGTLCATAPGEVGGRCIADCSTPTRTGQPAGEFERQIPFPQNQPEKDPRLKPVPKPKQGTIDGEIEKSAIEPK